MNATYQISSNERRGTKVIIYVDRALRGPLPDDPTRLKLHAAPYVEKAMELLGLPPTMRYSWSRTAGCRCGCSPGFKVHGTSAGLCVFANAPKQPKQLLLWS